LHAAQVSEVLVGAAVDEILPDHERGWRGALARKCVGRHDSHRYVATDGVPEIRVETAGTVVELTGCQKRKLVGEASHRDQLDVQSLLLEIALLLRDEDPGFGSESADSPCDFDWRTQGLIGGGRGC